MKMSGCQTVKRCHEFDVEESMSHTSKSVLAFSIYILILGFLVVFAPNMIFSLFRLPPAKDYWIFIVGMLLVGLSAYYAYAAFNELTSFMRLTAIMRSLILPYFAVLVLLGIAPASILSLAIIDLTFAIWTFWSLRVDRRNIT
jgi:hypothetical protein